MIVQPGRHAGFVARAAASRGCWSHGKTREETLHNLGGGPVCPVILSAAKNLAGCETLRAAHGDKLTHYHNRREALLAWLQSEQHKTNHEQPPGDVERLTL